jgi:hypothetical protein
MAQRGGGQLIMNNSTILAPNNWSTIAKKNNVKDNGLGRALSTYEKLEEDKHDERTKAITAVIQLGGALKKAKEVANVAEVVKYLTNLLAAAVAEQRDISKAKADAEKAEALAAKAEAMTQKKADAEAKKREQEEDEGDDAEEEEEEEDTGDYRENLKAAFKRLKSSKELVYNFIVCDAKPQCGLIVSKQRISARHKAELTKITGSKRFLKPGTCYVDSGKLVFDMEKAPSGLAAKLKKSFKYFTGLTVGVVVGDQSDEDEEEQPSPGAETAPSEPAAGTRPGQAAVEEPEAEQEAPERPALARAPEAWQQTQQVISTRIDQLKTAIRSEFADEGADLVTEIDQNMEKLDRILDNLDRKLADSLGKANEARNAAARAAELRNAKTILTNYIKYVKSEPLIAHIDANPFGVDINLKKTLTESLTNMAKAIG